MNQPLLRQQHQTLPVSNKTVAENVPSHVLLESSKGRENSQSELSEVIYPEHVEQENTNVFNSPYTAIFGLLIYLSR